MKRALLVCLLAACGHSHDGTNPDQPDASTSGDGGDTGPCTDGAMRCGANNEVQTCSNATWTSGDVCPLGCLNGACETSTSCAAGARACFGNVVGVCNPTGTAWLYETTCSDTCSAGACTGACVAGAQRCNAGNVESCNGTSWTVAQTCTSGCESNQCVLDRLDVTANTNLDGLVIVAGPVNVFAGATLTAPSGHLEIRAQSITVDAGGAIVVSPNGTDARGAGYPAASCYSQGVNSWASGGGGGHATQGTQGQMVGYTCGGFGGSTFGTGVDLVSESGGPGGAAAGSSFAPPGGGVLVLQAPAITIGGELHADGAAGTPGDVEGSGGGAGGAIVVAADQLAITGKVSAISGTSGGYGAGGYGYVKLVHGASAAVSGMLLGHVTQSTTPPLAISSLTEPDPKLAYNDDFTSYAASWPAPFASRQGYYWHVDTTAVAPPSAATATLALGEAIVVPASSFAAGDNYVHVVTIDAMTNVGTIESSFHIKINTAPPALSSQTHPDQTAWSTNSNPLFAWTLPQGDASATGVYYVLDHYGNTIPTTSDTFLPITQHQLLLASLADGIWVFHAISYDHAGRPTRVAGHYQIRLGADPGAGRAYGQVSGPGGALGNATVSFNRGVLPDQHTNSTGTYDLGGVPAGTWEVTASAPGLTPVTHMVTVTANGQIETDFTLAP